VPLRAWYPIEVLRFPLRSREQAERRVAGRSGPPDARSRIEQELLEDRRAAKVEERWAELLLGDEPLSHGITDDTLVVDERLRDALHSMELASPTKGGSPPRFILPSDGSGHLSLPAPTVVDDVAYAAECAALREVDFEPLVARIAELEQRIGSLEARFWPRLLRALSRAVRR
jgi:hypothetical protein